MQRSQVDDTTRNLLVAHTDDICSNGSEIPLTLRRNDEDKQCSIPAQINKEGENCEAKIHVLNFDIS